MPRTKTERLRLSSEDYNRLWRRVLERDSWRCQSCGTWTICTCITFNSAVNPLRNAGTISIQSFMVRHGEGHQRCASKTTKQISSDWQKLKSATHGAR
jgi:hypothetical protein